MIIYLLDKILVKQIFFKVERFAVEGTWQTFGKFVGNSELVEYLSISGGVSIISLQKRIYSL